MRYTVELTDEQATNLMKHATGEMFSWEIAMRAAVEAQRPQPLKVGDKVCFGGRGAANEILALGTHPQGYRWFVRDEGREPVFSYTPTAWTMADGSPIVWPT